jgi:hypothetical protein
MAYFKGTVSEPIDYQKLVVIRSCALHVMLHGSGGLSHGSMMHKDAPGSVPVCYSSTSKPA